MGPDVWAFAILTVFALLLIVWALCAAAGGADETLEEWARDRKEWRR